MKSIKTGKKMLFLESWPHGALIPVTILGENKISARSGKAYYFSKPDGGSDTTTTDFLFEPPLLAPCRIEAALAKLSDKTGCKKFKDTAEFIRADIAYSIIKSIGSDYK